MTTASQTRTEADTMGKMAVPAEALWGAGTQRAVLNFPISDLRMPRRFVQAIGRIKASGKAPGILTGDEALARRCIELGCLFTAVGADVAILARGAEALAARFKGR